MSDTYFVIHGNEDGEVSIDALPKEELEERLAEGYWGEVPVNAKLPEDYPYGLTIIKGSLVVPKPKEVVKAWEV